MNVHVMNGVVCLAMFCELTTPHKLNKLLQQSINLNNRLSATFALLQICTVTDKEVFRKGYSNAINFLMPPLDVGLNKGTG